MSNQSSQNYPPISAVSAPVSMAHATDGGHVTYRGLYSQPPSYGTEGTPARTMYPPANSVYNSIYQQVTPSGIVPPGSLLPLVPGMPYISEGGTQYRQTLTGLDYQPSIPHERTKALLGPPRDTATRTQLPFSASPRQNSKDAQPYSVTTEPPLSAGAPFTTSSVSQLRPSRGSDAGKPASNSTSRPLTKRKRKPADPERVREANLRFKQATQKTTQQKVNDFWEIVNDPGRRSRIPGAYDRIKDLPDLVPKEKIAMDSAMRQANQVTTDNYIARRQGANQVTTDNYIARRQGATAKKGEVGLKAHGGSATTED